MQDLPYVLMTNHFHLLVEPAEVGDLSRFMQSVGRRYVRYINETYDRSGTLWEGRFKSAAVSRDEYLIACSRYIELNPFRAGLVEHPKDYRWSTSAADWAWRIVYWTRIRGTQVWERLNKRDKKNIDSGQTHRLIKRMGRNPTGNATRLLGWKRTFQKQIEEMI